MALSPGSSDAAIDPADAFDLGEAFKRGALRVDSRELLESPDAFARGEQTPQEPIDFVSDEGRRSMDLVGTTYATLLLVSPRVIEVLEREGFSGWTTFAVAIDHPETENYAGLAVTGRCGPIRDALSERITLPPPVPGGRASEGLRGLCFQPESWDGSDLFTPANMTAIFVTALVKQALEAARISNVVFRRLSEIERPLPASTTK
jgi:hypothetical protein